MARSVFKVSSPLVGVHNLNEQNKLQRSAERFHVFPFIFIFQSQVPIQDWQLLIDLK